MTPEQSANYGKQRDPEVARRRRDEIVRLTVGALAGVMASEACVSGDLASRAAVDAAILAQKQIDVEEGDGF